MSESRINQSCMIIKSNNQSIIKSPMLGTHQNQFILHKLMSPISLFWNYEKTYSCLLKSRGVEDRLKTRAELKLFERKLDL